MRTVPVTGAAGSPSAQTVRYIPVYVNQQGPYLNNSPGYMVMITVSSGSSGAPGAYDVIVNSKGLGVLSDWAWTIPTAAAGTASADYNGPKMLIPSGATVNLTKNGANGGFVAVLIQCRSLEDALAIL